MLGTSLVIQWLTICLPMQGTRVDKGKLNIRSIKHMYGGFENFSALLGAGVVDTVPPEYSDHFLVAVSKYIKAHPESAKQIDDMHLACSQSIEFERALKDFIR